MSARWETRIRWAVGLLLTTAAGLKAVQLLIDSPAGFGNPLTKRILLIAISVEFSAGLIILSGIWWRQLRWLAAALFSMFAAYSFQLALYGEDSCGCFGPLRVHPWWTFQLDAVMLFGLLISIWWSPRHAEAELAPSTVDRKYHRVAVAGIAILVILSVAVVVRHAVNHRTFGDQLLSTARSPVALEPNSWEGRSLPIAYAIDLDLSQGKWIVLLHRHNCPDCHEAVLRYEELAMHKRVALVEVPPYGKSDSIPTAAVYRAQLRGDREWFIQTPVELQLENGVVMSASTKLPALLCNE